MMSGMGGCSGGGGVGFGLREMIKGKGKKEGERKDGR